MNPTKHAKKRSRQRGFNSLILDIISTHGRIESAPGGATKIFFGKKEAQRVIQEIKSFIQIVSKATGATLILKDNDIITVYKRG